MSQCPVQLMMRERVEDEEELQNSMRAFIGSRDFNIVEIQDSHLNDHGSIIYTILIKTHKKIFHLSELCETAHQHNGIKNCMMIRQNGDISHQTGKRASHISTRDKRGLKVLSYRML